MARKKIALIGAGQIGGTLALLAARDDLTLIAIDAAAKMLDQARASLADYVAAGRVDFREADALDALPRRCAEVMRLAVVDGQSSAEIAARLGLAESTVRVQLARGIARCAGFLRERGALK